MAIQTQSPGIAVYTKERKYVNKEVQKDDETYQEQKKRIEELEERNRQLEEKIR